MLDYDFLILSPNEFEKLSRDILQKKLSTHIESFTSGRDAGIDLRYATDKKGTSIIQAKRLKDYATLLSNLKKEVSKVRKVNPKCYIITTSVGLTPKNKDEIVSLFDPFIKSTSDIYGRDDINNLLGIYQDVERKYYKLWLSSTNILGKILHSKIYNQSSFEINEIKDQAKLFVQNDSFNRALKILKQNHYVIISGIPGIGKTTLARTLVLYLLKTEFDEFVYLADSINEGYEIFDDEKRQIFFFDDFLGRVRFEAQDEINVDAKIIKFIEKVKKSHNKVLIFATREYILNQARNTFETFEISNISIAKCILDLASYTRIIRAQIIYNHLFFAGIPYSHLQNLLENKNYLRLVNHRNYNPRVIETVINRRIWEHIEPNEFVNSFKAFFDNPESVWLYAFENSLDRFSQYALLVLVSAGTPILIKDFDQALQSFFSKSAYKFMISYDSIKFNRSLRELENTFINTQKDSYNEIVIEFQNPSIQDFLINYLREKEDLVHSLLVSANFTDQFFTIFTSSSNTITSRHVPLSSRNIETAITQVVKEFSNLRPSKVYRINKKNSNDFFWSRSTSFKYSFLLKIWNEFKDKSELAKTFVYEKFQEQIYLCEVSQSEQNSYITLLEHLDLKRLQFDEMELVDTFFKYIVWIDNYDVFVELSGIFPDSYKTFIGTPKFGENVEKVVRQETTNLEDQDISDMIEKIKTLENRFGLDFEKTLTELRVKESDYNDYLDSQSDSAIDEIRDNDNDRGLTEWQENQIIEQIFNSFIEE